MSEIDRLKNELAEAVKNSEEYVDFIECKRLLAENPETECAVDEMRRKNFELHNSEGIDDSFDTIDDIRRKYEYVGAQDVAGDFLKAELCLCRMVQDICKTIIEDIDFNLDFLK